MNADRVREPASWRKSMRSNGSGQCCVEVGVIEQQDDDEDGPLGRA
jgi:hypothetical protein